jgi:hypothetical protein
MQFVGQACADAFTVASLARLTFPGCLDASILLAKAFSQPSLLLLRVSPSLGSPSFHAIILFTL